MTQEEARVLVCNQAFYDAFARRDLAAMDRLWASDAAVTCFHPGWDLLIGRDAVMASWRAILRDEGPPIEASRERAFVAGDAAFVVCLEGLRGGEPSLAATNIFTREHGEWRLVHHHAGHLAQPAARPRMPGAN